MNKATAIKKAHGITPLAVLLGISHQAVSKWPEKVPAKRVKQLRQLRPSWFKKSQASGVQQ